MWKAVLDEMGSRIDELEQSINDLKAEMGADTAPAKASPEETKPESAERIFFMNAGEKQHWAS